jgi:hypothetical protein
MGGFPTAFLFFFWFLARNCTKGEDTSRLTRIVRLAVCGHVAAVRLDFRMEKPKATPGEAQRSKLKQELLYVIAQHLEDDKMSTVAEQCVIVAIYECRLKPINH